MRQMLIKDFVGFRGWLSNPILWGLLLGIPLVIIFVLLELFNLVALIQKDRFRFRRVGDQSSGEQADGGKTTDGMEPAWSTSPPADKNPRTRRGVGEHLPALVSVFPSSSASQENGLTPENLPLSNDQVPDVFGS